MLDIPNLVSQHHVRVAHSLHVYRVDTFSVNEHVFVSCWCSDGNVSSIDCSDDIWKMRHLVKRLLGGSHCMVISWKFDESWCQLHQGFSDVVDAVTDCRLRESTAATQKPLKTASGIKL